MSSKIELFRKLTDKIEHSNINIETAEFIETFVEKFQLELPQDIFFDASAIFDLF